MVKIALGVSSHNSSSRITFLMNHDISHVVSYSKVAQTNQNWDLLTNSIFQRREFLSHLEKYNFCNQTYYEGYSNGEFVVATIVYTIKLDLFTFSNISLPINTRIIGLPVSVAAPPIIGNKEYHSQLLKKILDKESGLILGLNFESNYLSKTVVNMETLPTMVACIHNHSYASYLGKMRHPYRRRIKSAQKSFKDVESIESSCKSYEESHHDLYLEIMNKTTTKLETLSLEFFQNLPDSFLLTSHFSQGKLIAWQITAHDKPTLYFLFGGLNYAFRDKYNSYYNNLISILLIGLKNNYESIDFGQTAEVPKMRMGSEMASRKMFIYHRNKFINYILHLLKSLISYSYPKQKSNVFKNSAA